MVSGVIQDILNRQAHNLRDVFSSVEKEFKRSSESRKNPSSLNQNLKEQTTQTVEKWIKSGVYLLTSEDFEKYGRSCLNEIEFLCAFGRPCILTQRSISVLNSRRAKKISPNDRWIRKTLALVREAKEMGLTLVSSFESIQYNIVMAAAKGNKVIIVCPGPLPFMASPDYESFFHENYGELLDYQNTIFLSAHGPEIFHPKSSSAFMRDRLVGLLSDAIFSVDVSKHGNMSKIIEEAYTRNVEIRYAYQQNREDSVLAPTISLNHCECCQTDSSEEKFVSHDDLELNHPEFYFSEILGSWVVCLGNATQWINEPYSFLFHYTRSHFGPWPGQTVSNFVNSLIKKDTGSAHTAFDTLHRIAIEGKIRASGSLIRGKYPVVSFTEVPPKHLENIRKWRRGFSRWSFEPYAIVFRKQSLEEIGAKKVIYGTSNEFYQLPQEEKHLFQVRQTQDVVWSIEKEWRMKGDVEIRRFSSPEYAFMLPTKNEADIFVNLLRKQGKCL